MKEITIVKFLSKKGKVVEMDKSKATLSEDTVILDEYNITPKEQKQEFTYPMMMENYTGYIVEFINKDSATVLTQNNGGYAVGYSSSRFISHTDSSIWKPYNPICDHALDNYYVEASVEALCALKVLGYKSNEGIDINKENRKWEIYFIINGDIRASVADTVCDCKPMTFKDGKFITEPEKPKFEVGNYITSKSWVDKDFVQIAKIEDELLFFERNSVIELDEAILWTIEEADPESYAYCWNNGSTVRQLRQVKNMSIDGGDNYAPDINNEAERLGLK